MILYPKEGSETKREYAYRVLKENIMNLELKPKQSISESEISEIFNISRTPIREILMQLRGERLIEVYPQIGTFVAPIDKSFVEQEAFMRAILEAETLKIACEDCSTDILIELEKNLFSQKLIQDKINNEIEFQKLDFEFHKLIFMAANKEYVWDSIIKNSNDYNRMRLFYGLSKEVNTNSRVIKQHEEILEFIKNGKRDKIEEIVMSHLVNPIKKWEMLYKEI